MITDLTSQQKDYALFLPATSGFYASFIGYQRKRYPYVPPQRIPSNFVNDVESINYLDPQNGLYHYKWCLYSAGHANLDLNKQDDREEMFRTRNRSNSWVLGDSGGFQIGKGKWQADWKDPNCPQAQKKRSQVLNWMDSLMDYGMCLDIPAWVSRSPEGQKATGITTYAEAVQGTYINNDYFIRNRNGNCKFLNVLQGENHADAEDWYQRMKKYCDPKQYPNEHFNGWAMGGQNMCDVHLVLKRLVSLRFDGLLETGKHDWMHFLGTSKLEWALLLTDIQRAVRKYHNPNFSISFDCASPFLATANGQIYVQTEIEDRKKWLYRMLPSVDNKKYANDTRLFRDVVIQDGWFKSFTNSPVMDQVKMNEICVYAPGNLNRMGKENKTSWDSFTYAIMMSHNVWMHIRAVQEANDKYDQGLCPAMLVEERFDRLFFKDIIEAIFATSDRGTADAIVDEFSRFWMAIPGTRGAVGKKTVNASTNYAKLFEEVTPTSVQLESERSEAHESGEFDEDEVDKLEELEEESENDSTR
jgi:hypothetical protein